MTVATALSIVAIGVSLFTLFIQDRRNKRQQFESSFFGLLAAIRELVVNTRGSISTTDETDDQWEIDTSTDITGYDYYRSANRELHLRIQQAILNDVEIDDLMVLADNQRKEFIQSICVKTYDGFFDDHISELAHYFRFIYNVVDFVDKAEGIRPKDKEKYMRFIQAQMLSEELSLMFYNGIGKYGKKMKPMLDWYDFLQNINPEDTDDLVYILHTCYPTSKFRFINSNEKPDIDKIIEQVQNKAQVNDSK